MSPNSTECISNQLNFGTIKGRKVIADFTGGRITSDAGIVKIMAIVNGLCFDASFSSKLFKKNLFC